MEELKKAIKEIVEQEIVKIVISNKKDKDEKYNKIVILLKETPKKKYYQIEKYTDKQVFHKNIELNMLEETILELMESKYKQLSAWSVNMNFDLKISKKNKVFLGKKKSDNSNITIKGHNKEKNYILKEGTIIQPLIDLGVFTKDGKVVNSQYDKYKQINRFIEIIDDEVKKNKFEELTVLDFGCGKSYLTFVLYYYFTEIKKINVKMIGLDLKADVIKKCNDIAKKYNYKNLSFELGDINGIPRILDAGQCNDCYSLAVIALKLQEAFGLDDINDLPIVYNIAWYEQKAAIVLLSLLYLGVKNIHLGPTLPAFLSPNVTNVLVEHFGIGGITTVENDLEQMIMGA